MARIDTIGGKAAKLPHRSMISQGHRMAMGPVVVGNGIQAAAPRPIRGVLENFNMKNEYPAAFYPPGNTTHPERTAGKPCAAKKIEKDKGKGLTGMKEGAYNSCRCRFGRRPGDELKKL